MSRIIGWFSDPKTKTVIYLMSGIVCKRNFNPRHQKLIIATFNDCLHDGTIDAWYIKGEISNCLLRDKHNSISAVKFAIDGKRAERCL